MKLLPRLLSFVLVLLLLSCSDAKELALSDADVGCTLRLRGPWQRVEESKGTAIAEQFLGGFFDPAYAGNIKKHIHVAQKQLGNGGGQAAMILMAGDYGSTLMLKPPMAEAVLANLPDFLEAGMDGMIGGVKRSVPNMQVQVKNQYADGMLMCYNAELSPPKPPLVTQCISFRLTREFLIVMVAELNGKDAGELNELVEAMDKIEIRPESRVAREFAPQANSSQR